MLFSGGSVRISCTVSVSVKGCRESVLSKLTSMKLWCSVRVHVLCVKYMCVCVCVCVCARARA